MTRRRLAFVVASVIALGALGALVAVVWGPWRELPPILEERADPTDVPARWREVRDSRGHQRHVAVAGVACLRCHEGPGFAPPPPAVCARCHEVAQPLHEQHDLGLGFDVGVAVAPGGGPGVSGSPGLSAGVAPTPACIDCHRFRDRATLSDACMGCHTTAQRGRVAAVGRHAPAPGASEHDPLACTTCHRAHRRPTIDPPSCASCHLAAGDVRHAGVPGLHRATPQHQSCASCHRAHEPTGRADRQTCLACHQDRSQHEPAAVSCAACHPFGQ